LILSICQLIVYLAVPIKSEIYQFTPTFITLHLSEIDTGRRVSHVENGRTIIMNVAAEFRFIEKET
jgi:hypothetical protein